MPVKTGIQVLQGFPDLGFRRGDVGEGFFITLLCEPAPT